MDADSPSQGPAAGHVRGAHPGAVVGLPPGMRYRCEGCGNLTRFDVAVAERANVFWHVSVAGIGEVEEADIAERSIESVACRWCGSTDRIVVESSPAGGPDPV